MKNMSERAEDVYKFYPRKVGKRTALKAIHNAMVRLFDGEMGVKLTWDQAEEYLISRTRLFASSPAGNKGIFTPYPATFYNRASYSDDPQEWWAESDRDLENRREANVGRYIP